MNINVVASTNVASMIIILTMVVFTTKLCRTFLIDFNKIILV